MFIEPHRKYRPSSFRSAMLAQLHMALLKELMNSLSSWFYKHLAPSGARNNHGGSGFYKHFAPKERNQPEPFRTSGGKAARAKRAVL